ncbi:MAG TPA: AraC family transcriptional regulator [Polyangiaceae bacterium]|nr:AraC family transcriptional regulator [Polyangiaceae bacterium]
MSDTGVDHSAAREQHPRLRPVFELIEADLASDLSVARAARAVGLSASHFRRYFKQLTQLSYVRYLHTYRVERACELLRRTELDLSEIATRLGFCDQSYFGLIFRRHLRTTPAAYRRQCRSQSTPPPASTGQSPGNVVAA